MQLRTQAVLEIDRPIDQVYDYSVSNDNFATIMRGRMLIPGVVSVVMLDGAALSPGARRRVELSDGSYVIEQILDLTKPSRQAYRWDSKLKFPLSLLVAGAEAEWLYSSTSTNGTRIEWNYRFTLTTPVVYPLARVMVGQFKGWMSQSLAAIRSEMSRR